MKGEQKRGFVGKWILNGSMAAALVAAVSVFAIMLQIEKNELSGYERSAVFRAIAQIPKGQAITAENYKEYIEVVQLDKSCIAPTAITNAEQVEGLIAAADIEEGVFLTTGMFDDLVDITDAMNDPVIVGIKAEDLYQVAGGILRAGDHINIYKVSEDTGAVLVWNDVYVQQVFDNGGRHIANGDDTAAAQRINIYMDNKDVEYLYTELASGSLRVVKVCD